MKLVSSQTSSPDSRRWTALMVVCLAQLMIVLDVTIVNVALPSIQRDLHFSQSDLTWVVNAFLVTFGSLLLLAGRLGDLAGRKRVFLAGLVTFTAASLLCGLAPSQGALIAARFLQGVGAAAQASVILAIIITEFPTPSERARAMSAYVFVSVAGGSLGLLAGGILTQALSWHWVFFVNLPIGLATFLLGQRFIRADGGLGLEHGVDWLGSILVTASLMGVIYAIMQATTYGWISTQVLGFGAVAALLMAAFVALEARIENPIMPMRILRLQGLVNASLVRGFLVTGMYSTFFLGSLYLEHVRHYSAVQTGAAFLPWTITVAVLSQGITARLVARFGPLRVLTAGMASAVVGLLLFSTVGAEHRLLPHDLLRLLRDRPGHRHRVHAAADPRHGRRSGRRLGPRLGDHQRLPADQRRARPGRPQHHRREPDEGTAIRPPRAHELADRRLPPRLPRRRGNDHRWRRPRLRAPAAAPRAAGAELAASPRRTTPLTSTSTSREKPHDTTNRFPAHTTPAGRDGRRSPPAARQSCAAAEDRPDFGRCSSQLHPRHLATTPGRRSRVRSSSPSIGAVRLRHRPPDRLLAFLEGL